MSDEDKDWRGRAENPTPEEAAEDLSDYLNAKAEQFGEMCAELREAEAPFHFLAEDVVGQMLQALAETVVLCQKQAIKLMMLQDHLTQDLSKQDALIMKDDGIGFSTFKGVKDEWGKQ